MKKADGFDSGRFVHPVNFILNQLKALVKALGDSLELANYINSKQAIINQLPIYPKGQSQVQIKTYHFSLIGVRRILVYVWVRFSPVLMVLTMVCVDIG